MGGRTKVEDGPAASVEGGSYAEGGCYVAGCWEAGEEEDGFFLVRSHRECCKGWLRSVMLGMISICFHVSENRALRCIIYSSGLRNRLPD